MQRTPQPKQSPPARLIVRFKPGYAGAATAAAAGGSSSLRPIASKLNMYAVDLASGVQPEKQAEQLQKLSGER